MTRTSQGRFAALAALAALPVGALWATQAERAPSIRDAPVSGFVIEHEVVVPGRPEVIFDAITGDISPWWDHSFTKSPKRFYIEAKPGGGFYEIFDDAGNGARHATVILADRGKILRFEGPLGLSGAALTMVHTYTFEAVGDSTRLKVAVHGAGEVQEGWPAAVDRAWRHFLFERFKPYVESGRHLRR